jgi:xanthine dehydrogenase YagS FAD-binding subunit
VNPSDTAPALIALGARIKTSKREVDAEEFFAVNGTKTTTLDNDEIVIEIQVPAPMIGTRSSFVKFAIRKSGDFPIVNCAAAIASQDGKVKGARICLKAVYNTPYRVMAAEEAVRGKPIDELTAGISGSAAGSMARPMTKNKYKIEISKTLVKRAVLACK